MHNEHKIKILTRYKYDYIKNIIFQLSDNILP
jgi:hypothetical protein